MSDFKGTPGPWTVDEEAFDNDGCPETVIRALKGVAGVAVAIDFGPNNPGMREANAHLIAAAPGLFEALQALRLAREQDKYSSWEKGVPEFAKAEALADAALAKALGAKP